jgi:stage III sporulation protein AG
MDGSEPRQRINALFGKYKYPILVVLVGLGLLLLPTRETEMPPVPVETVREASLEQRLEELLAQIEGAGAVRVLLTEDVGRETVWQTDVQSDADSVREDTVILEDSARNEIGLVRRTTEPSYRGAVILCQGADAPSVKLAIVEAVRCVTGLGADQISVQKMN